MSDQKKSERPNEVGRRTLLRALTIGTGTVATLPQLPGSWSKPAIQTVLLPAHAQTTGPNVIFAAGGSDAATQAASTPFRSILDSLTGNAHAQEAEFEGCLSISIRTEETEIDSVTLENLAARCGEGSPLYSILSGLPLEEIDDASFELSAEEDLDGRFWDLLINIFDPPPETGEIGDVTLALDDIPFSSFPLVRDATCAPEAGSCLEIDL